MPVILNEEQRSEESFEIINIFTTFGFLKKQDK